MLKIAYLLGAYIRTSNDHLKTYTIIALKVIIGWYNQTSMIKCWHPMKIILLINNSEPWFVECYKLFVLLEHVNKIAAFKDWTLWVLCELCDRSSVQKHTKIHGFTDHHISLTNQFFCNTFVSFKKYYSNKVFYIIKLGKNEICDCASHKYTIRAGNYICL